jgi:hypothetical protein
VLRCLLGIVAQQLLKATLNTLSFDAHRPLRFEQAQYGIGLSQQVALIGDSQSWRVSARNRRAEVLRASRKFHTAILMAKKSDKLQLVFPVDQHPVK